MSGVYYTGNPFSGVNHTRTSTPADSRLSDLILDVLATSFTLGMQRVSSLSLAINTTSFIWADSRDSARLYPHVDVFNSGTHDV